MDLTKDDFRFSASPASRFSRSWVELGAEGEGLLEVLDEDADFGGHAAAGGAHGKYRHGSFVGCEETEDGAFAELGGEEPCRRLGDAEMFEDAHSHLLDVAGSKDPGGEDALCVWSEAEGPRLDGAALDEDDRWKAFQVFRHLRRAVTREVLGCGDENDHRLGEAARDEGGVGEVTGVDSEIEAVFNDGCGVFGCGQFDGDVG